MQSIVIPAGETVTNISLNIINDTDSEEDETFMVMLVESNCICHNLSESLTTVQIVDNDERMNTYS